MNKANNSCRPNLNLLWIFIPFFSLAAIFPSVVLAQKTGKSDRMLNYNHLASDGSIPNHVSLRERLLSG